MFDQPELEHLLRTNLKDQTTVGLRGNVEVTDVAQDGQGRVQVDFTDRLTGQPESLLADYVLGCDGANSIVRTAIGSTMQDLTFEQRWLVIDIATTADLDQWDGVHQVCDPHRAATFMRIGQTRYRWEFRLLPGETAADYDTIEDLLPLIGPWVQGTPSDRLELVRVAEYTFRAQLADHWRDRNVFLLGDAAHLTPPFVGQGMGAGLRDAMNLSWKIAGVLSGDLPESVLDTYQAERKPHARAMIRLAKLVGVSMTQGGRAGDLLRHLIAPRAHWVPGLRHRLLDGETPRLSRSALILRPPARRSLAGSLCPNALLADGRRARRGDRKRVRPGERRTPLTTATGPTGRARRSGRRGRDRVTATQMADCRPGDRRRGPTRPDGDASGPRRRGAVRGRPAIPGRQTDCTNRSRRGRVEESPATSTSSSAGHPPHPSTPASSATGRSECRRDPVLREWAIFRRSGAPTPHPTELGGGALHALPTPGTYLVQN